MKEKKLKEIERQSENASHKQSNWSRDFDFFQAFSIVNIFTAFMATIINITSQRKINLFQRDDRLVLIDRLIELFSAHIHEKMISRIKKKINRDGPDIFERSIICLSIFRVWDVEKACFSKMILSVRVLTDFVLFWDPKENFFSIFR